jgi:Leucine Rich Repeat (LRR) protein
MGFFKKKRERELNEVLPKINLPDKDSFVQVLSKNKIKKYFDFGDNTVIRNLVPTPWEKLKKGLKLAGKWALKSSIPAAIGLVTGGAGLVAVIGPLVSNMVAKFKSRGLNVSEDSQNQIEDVIANKSDDSVDNLMVSLNNDNPQLGNKGRSIIKVALNEELYPILSEMQTVLSRLEEEQHNLKEILTDWMDEQREQINTLSEEQKQGFGLTIETLDKIETELGSKLDELDAKLDTIQDGVSLTSTGISEANTRLVKLESKIDMFLKEACQESLLDFNLGELIQISKAQFQKIKIAGKLGKPFDPDLFINTPPLDRTFLEYLRQVGNQQSLFLLLAYVGLGKTWNAAHLSIKAREMEIAIPFFIPIHMGYEELLSDIFNVKGSGLATQIGEKCKNIYENNQKKVLLVFDGLDEYPVPNRQPFLNFLDQLLGGYGNSVHVLLTDRITDWCQNDSLKANQFYKTVSPYLYVNSELDSVKTKYFIPTGMSGYLSGFTDLQLDQAIRQYELDFVKIEQMPKLYGLCHRPYILRLLLERDEYPDPDDIHEFLPLFYDRLDSSNTILGRMGLVGSVSDFFFGLVRHFNSSTARKTDIELNEITDSGRDPRWQSILCSGIVMEEPKEFGQEYYFEPIFQPVLEYYLSKVSNSVNKGQATSVEASNVGTAPIQQTVTGNQPISTSIPITTESGGLSKDDYYSFMGQAQEMMLNEKWRLANEKWVALEKLCIVENWEERRTTVLKQIEKCSREIKILEGKEQIYESMYSEAMNLKKNREWDDAIAKLLELQFKCEEFGWEDKLEHAKEESSKCAELKAQEKQQKEKFLRMHNEAMSLNEGKKWKPAKILWDEIKYYCDSLGWSNETNEAINMIRLCEENIEKAQLSDKYHELVANANSSVDKGLWDNAKSNLLEAIEIGRSQKWEIDVVNLLQQVAKCDTAIDKSRNDIHLYNQINGDIQTQLMQKQWDNALMNLQEIVRISAENNWQEKLDKANSQIELCTKEIAAEKDIREKFDRLSAEVNEHIMLSQYDPALEKLRELNAFCQSKGWTIKQEKVIKRIGEVEKIKNAAIIYQRQLNQALNAMSAEDGLNKLENLYMFCADNDLLSFQEEIEKQMKNMRDFKRKRGVALQLIESDEFSTAKQILLESKALSEANSWLSFIDEIQNLITDCEKGESDIEIINYNGASIVGRDVKVIQNLELLLNTPIPIIQDLDIDGFGMIVENNKVVELSLKMKRMEGLPPNIGELKQLKVFDAQRNQFNSLPQSFWSLKKLEKLYLSRNSLKSLPENIGSLQNLQVLDVSGNILDGVPRSIGQLTKLKELFLKSNMFYSLPPEVESEINKLKSAGCNVRL